MSINNKLILEFMGEKPMQINSKLWSMSRSPWLSVTGETSEKVLNDFSESTMYDSNWEWIMPVVEKICEIKHWTINATLEWLADKFLQDGIADIKDIYNTIIKFIKWYNKDL